MFSVILLSWTCSHTTHHSNWHPSSSYFASSFVRKLMTCVKCCVAAVKSYPDFISLLLYFFWSFGINDYNTFSIENWIPLKPVLGGVRDLALFIISREQTQFSFLYFGLVALQGSTFYHNFELINSNYSLEYVFNVNMQLMACTLKMSSEACHHDQCQPETFEIAW